MLLLKKRPLQMRISASLHHINYFIIIHSLIHLSMPWIMASSTRNDDDFLVREIMLTHDPDDHCHVDSELLLSLIEATFSCTTENPIALDQETTTFDVYPSASSEEPVSRAVYKISNEMLARCNEGENLPRNTLEILEMLGCYRWDAKMVVALASFMQTYGLFRLILQLQSGNELAFSLAFVKRIPSTITLLKPRFKALKLLVGTVLRLTRFIISYESLSVKHELVDNEDREITRSKIYLASYWICRSLLVCSSQIADLRNLSLEQVCSDRTVVAAWGLYSLGNKLNSLCSDLEVCIHKSKHQIEIRLYEKLLIMPKEKEAEDNQKALRTLFAWDNEFPFKNSLREKIGILELKNKTVLLLITKPDLLPLDQTYFLVQQTTASENCVVIWIPVPSMKEWSSDAKNSFEFFSSRVPWLSLRRPWSLNSTVMNFIREEYHFYDDPIIVVLDETGLVSNTNAMDMVWIWGPKAFPFSTSREKELWKEARWSVGLIINGITPLLSEWVEQGRNLCIYGSDNIDWIRELNKKIKKVRDSGIELEAVYVGCKNGGENVRSIIHTIDEEGLSSSITFNSINFFWSRLETLKRSIGVQEKTSNCNEIEAKVEELLDLGSRDGWLVIGSSCSIVEQELLERGLEDLHTWRENVGDVGLVGAIRGALEARVEGERCKHDEVVEYEEGLIEKRKICGSCKGCIEKFVLYKCEA